MIKKNHTMLFMIGCLAILLIGTSYAFWFGQIGHTNQLKADTVTAEIKEVFRQNTAPTGKVQKQVSFRNDSSSSVFLRVCYAETWQSTENDKVILLNNQINGSEVAVKKWKNGFGEESSLWADGGDGWFYYKKVLEPGATTESILEEVTFPDHTGKYDTTLTEDYNPSDGDNWEPGAEVNKDVTVKNTGDYDVLVRVKFSEKWANKDTKEIFKSLDNLQEGTYQESATDGLVANDESVVKKTLNKTNWVYNSADGYWYYKTNLAAETDTDKFLDAVTLLEDADMGKYIVKNYYTSADKKPAEDEIGTDPATQWVEYTGNVPDKAKHSMAVTKQDPNASGYANADYTLTITAQTVQATEAAMKDAFGLTAQPDGCTWTLGK